MAQPVGITCLAFGILVLALVTCSAPTRVSYAPPASKGGKLCVEQCGKSRSYCGWSCDLDFRACFVDEQAAAQKAYEQYADKQFAQHAQASLVPSAFEHRGKCDVEKKSCQADCDQPYNTCYNSCGGVVTPAN